MTLSCLQIILFIALMLKVSGVKKYECADPCDQNNDHCGFWDLECRIWYPNGCQHRLISPKEARQCIGNRTLSFIGDSQMRDLGVAAGFFLSGISLNESVLNKKFNRAVDIENLSQGYGHRIINIDLWPFFNRKTLAHFLFQGKEDSTAQLWQIQVFELYLKSLNENLARDIFWNRLTNANISPAGLYFRNVTLAFWQFGLHSYSNSVYTKGGFTPFAAKPYSPTHYIKNDVELFEKVIVENPPVDVVWTAMNNYCKYNGTQKIGSAGLIIRRRSLHLNKGQTNTPKNKIKVRQSKASIVGRNGNKQHIFWRQGDFIEDGNTLVKRRCHKNNLPFWDSGELESFLNLAYGICK